MMDEYDYVTKKLDLSDKDQLKITWHGVEDSFAPEELKLKLKKK
jgi:hypothetical protein